MSAAYSQDTILTVFLGRGLTAEGIRQTLEDFAETGLVRNLVWIDADSFHESSSEVTHLATNQDGLPELQRRPFNELVSRSRTTKLHIGVINVIDGSEGMLHAEELNPLVGIIDSVCSHHQIHRSNVMIGAVAAPLDEELPILRGYVNLMLAPEDSHAVQGETVIAETMTVGHCCGAWAVGRQHIHTNRTARTCERFQLSFGEVFLQAN